MKRLPHTHTPQTETTVQTDRPTKNREKEGESVREKEKSPSSACSFLSLTSQCMAFSPVGHMLATGAVDLKLRLWDSSNGSLLATLDHGE